MLAGIDQWIKAWATANLLPVGAMPLIPGIVELRYSLNQGMAFSHLWGRQGFLIAVTSIALLAVAVYLFWKRPPLAERIAWTMVLGGGVGNLIDRIVSGQVVDYINLLFVDLPSSTLPISASPAASRCCLRPSWPASCGNAGAGKGRMPAQNRRRAPPPMQTLEFTARRRLPASGWTAFLADACGGLTRSALQT